MINSVFLFQFAPSIHSHVTLAAFRKCNGWMSAQLLLMTGYKLSDLKDYTNSSERHLTVMFSEHIH